jgi:hypothetical protein
MMLKIALIACVGLVPNVSATILRAVSNAAANVRVADLNMEVVATSYSYLYTGMPGEEWWRDRPCVSAIPRQTISSNQPQETPLTTDASQALEILQNLTETTQTAKTEDEQKSQD